MGVGQGEGKMAAREQGHGGLRVQYKSEAKESLSSLSCSDLECRV